jgi:hypothetical protein
MTQGTFDAVGNLYMLGNKVKDAAVVKVFQKAGHEITTIAEANQLMAQYRSAATDVSRPNPKPAIAQPSFRGSAYDNMLNNPNRQVPLPLRGGSSLDRRT